MYVCMVVDSYSVSVCMYVCMYVGFASKISSVCMWVIQVQSMGHFNVCMYVMYVCVVGLETGG